jgi:16S rRNA processing protein RimM
VTEAKGLRGEVKVFFFAGSADPIKNQKFILLSEPESKPEANVGGTTFEIERWAPTNSPSKVNIKFKNINDRNSAEALKGLELYISSEAFVSEPGEKIYLGELEGFHVMHGASKDSSAVIGLVTGFSSNGPQDILILNNKEGGEILIPLVKEFILEIDFKQKKIFMNLPEGLLSVNEG